MESQALLTTLGTIVAIVGSVATAIGAILYARRKRSEDYVDLLEAELELTKKKLAECEDHRSELYWELRQERRKNGRSDERT